MRAFLLVSNYSLLVKIKLDFEFLIFITNLSSQGYILCKILWSGVAENGKKKKKKGEKWKEGKKNWGKLHWKRGKRPRPPETYSSGEKMNLKRGGGGLSISCFAPPPLEYFPVVTAQVIPFYDYTILGLFYSSDIKISNYIIIISLNCLNLVNTLTVLYASIQVYMQGCYWWPWCFPSVRTLSTPRLPTPPRKSSGSRANQWRTN